MGVDRMGDIAHTGHEPMRWTVTRVVKAGGHDWSIVDGPYCQRVEVVEAQQLEGAVGALAEAIDIAERHLPDNRSTYRADRQRLAELRASLNQQRGAVGPVASGPLNASLVTDVRATAATLDERGAWLLNYAADNLSAGERALGVLRISRAIARGTPPERERLEPLLDRARRAKTGTNVVVHDG